MTEPSGTSVAAPRSDSTESGDLRTPLSSGSDATREERALIHLSWQRTDSERRLIFGWVEILPTCFPPMRGHPFRSHECRRGGPTFYVARFPMSAAAAHEWFAHAASGNMRLPAHPDRPTPGDGQSFLEPPDRAEPEDGSESSSQTLPFLPAVHGTVFCRGLFGKVDPTIKAELSVAKSAAWLRENIFIDLDRYSEYLGSLLLVRHHPTIRDVGGRLAYEDGRELELVRIRHWPGATLVDHRLLAAERRMLGFSKPLEKPVNSSLMKLDWGHKVERTALAILHPSHGICWWREPLPFLRGIQVNIDLGRETRRIVQEVDETGQISRHYDVAWRERAPHLVAVGEGEAGETPSSREWQAEARRRQITMAASLGLKWFDEPEAAQEAIRKIIGGARQSLLVVDPYFGPAEVRDFALAVTSHNVSVTIITSAECLAGDMDPPLQGAKDAAMEDILSKLHTEIWAVPSVCVMLGHRAPLHDRFILADGRVWLSGNSLNAIGSRASVLIEIPNPQEVLGHLKPFIDAAQPFGDWLANRRKLQPSPEGTPDA